MWARRSVGLIASSARQSSSVKPTTPWQASGLSRPAFMRLRTPPIGRRAPPNGRSTPPGGRSRQGLGLRTARHLGRRRVRRGIPPAGDGEWAAVWIGYKEPLLQFRPLRLVRLVLLVCRGRVSNGQTAWLSQPYPLRARIPCSFDPPVYVRGIKVTGELSSLSRMANPLVGSEKTQLRDIPNSPRSCRS